MDDGSLDARAYGSAGVSSCAFYKSSFFSRSWDTFVKILIFFSRSWATFVKILTFFSRSWGTYFKEKSQDLDICISISWKKVKSWGFVKIFVASRLIYT